MHFRPSNKLTIRGHHVIKMKLIKLPGMKPDLDALQRNIALMKDLGFTKSDIDVKKYSDLSLIEAAGARLK